uniref:Uncharacterized protein n=1 Tax=Neogobius melanostomus TaxID=47308 RepID=A0A8C6WZL8_9GOBI
GLCQKARKIGTHISVSAGNKPFYFPKDMTTAPFLQHPSLTAGQRRYLHSITNIYSTEQMRRQMKQHYLDVLHSCLQSGLRRRCGDLQLQQTQKFRKQSTEKETGARTKAQGRRQSSTHPNIRLPKIVNR